MKRIASVSLAIVFAFQFLSGQSAATYLSYDELTRAVNKLADTHKDIVKVESIGKTLKGRDLWAIALRKGDPNQDRAILIVGGVDALEIAGSDVAMHFAEYLADNYGKVDSVGRLLESTTIYILPRVTPDAMEAYFEKPARERTTNLRPTDDDHDGQVDEDDAEDINKDGFITLMRVKDSHGEWMPHPEDARIMKKADPAKGEHGQYLLYAEGIDNDKDEKWNEDAVGGVDFNRNFAYNYEFFASNSGVYQLSEPETRSVAEFLFNRPNIAVVFSFSPNDNLMTPMKIESRTPTDDQSGFGGRRGFVAGPSPTADLPYFEYISKQFQDITKLKDAPEPKKGNGAFSDWVYYHAGRWSFSVRPWWAPAKRPARDSSAAMPARGGRSARPQQQTQEAQDDYTEQLRALSWYDANGMKDVFLPWTKYKHPDFPDNQVEIGGIKPYAVYNPPADSLATLQKPFFKFLTYLSSQLPKISIENSKVERVGEGVYRLSIDVANSGYLPTVSALGMRVRWPRSVYLTLKTSKEQTIASGRPKQRLGQIKGNGGYETISWLITARSGSTVTVSAESPMAGSATQTFTLR